MRTPYPGYDVMAKRRTPSFNEVTRGVLDRRLHAVPGRRAFTAEEFRTLEAVCARLIPQPEREAPVPIAPWIDADLHEGRGEGYRHPDMPPAREAWRRALAGIDAEARRRFGPAFASLPADSQDAVLHAVQAGDVDPAAWEGLPPTQAFDQLVLKAAVGVYYSHPAAWSEIGFGGPASPRGYVRLDKNRRDPWEAAEGKPGQEKRALQENRHVV